MGSEARAHGSGRETAMLDDGRKELEIVEVPQHCAPALAGAQWTVLDPVDHQLSLLEEPAVFQLSEMVQIAN